MSVDWNAAAKAHWDEQPHPLAPGLKIGEFAAAVKLATKIKFGGHATAKEAELFWQEYAPLRAAGVSPMDFEHAVDRLAPLSYAYHGRPPSMAEIARLHAEDPQKARSYYSELPDRDHPHVSAGQMVKALQTAKPHFQEHLKRPPTKTEAAYLVHSGESAVEFARRLRNPAADGSLESDGAQARAEPDRGGRGVAPTGGQAVDQ